MSISNGKVYAPIGLHEVASLLGESQDVGSVCTSNSINKWAKYKPVIIDSPQQRHIVTGGADRPELWYRGDDGKCGLNVTIFTPATSGFYVDAIAAAYRNGNQWTYNKPKTNDWKRLLDFEGYYHYAKPFLYTGIPDGTEYNVNINGNRNITFGIQYRGNIRDDELSMSDFEDLYAATADKILLTGVLLNKNPLASGTTLIADDAEMTQTSVEGVTSNPSVTLTIPLGYERDAAWVLLFMEDGGGSNRRFLLPYDSDNYFCFKINVSHRSLLTGTMTSIGSDATGSRVWSTTYGTQSNPIPTNGGKANIYFRLQITNNTGSTVTVGQAGSARFAFRATLGHNYGTVNLIAYSGDNSAISKSITNGQTVTIDLMAPTLFAKAWEDLLDWVQSINTSITIEMYDTQDGSGPGVWETFIARPNMWFKR